MKRALPFLLFGGVTLAVFWRFLLLGQTIYCTGFLMGNRGPVGWLGGREHVLVADNILLLRTHLEVYNEGLKAGELRLWNPRLFCGIPIYADPMVHPFYPPNLLLHALLPPDPALEIGLMFHLFFSGVAMYWALRVQGRSPPGATAGALVWMLFGYSAVWFSTAILMGISVFGPIAFGLLVRSLDRKKPAAAALAGAAMGMAVLGSHPQYALHLFLLLLAWLGMAAWREPSGARAVLRIGGVFALVTVGAGLAEILARLDTLANGYRVPGQDLPLLYRDPWTVVGQVLGLAFGKIHFPADGELEYEFPLYAGTAAVALALAGAARGFRDPQVRFAALGAAGAFAFALLRPLAEVLDLVPILNASPASRWILAGGFCLALLAARGTDELIREAGRAPLLLSAACVGVGGVALGVRNGAALETLLGLALATAAAWTLRRRPAVGIGLGAAALLLELLPHFIMFNPHTDPEPLYHVSKAREGRALSGPDEPPVADNVKAIFGRETVQGFEAILPEAYVRFILASGGAVNPTGRIVKAGQPPTPLLRAALGPRARVVTAVIPATTPDEAMTLCRAPTFDPARAAVVEGEVPDFSPEGESPPVERLGRQKYRVQSRGGVLVVFDTHYPGWTATVDGAPAPLLRANIAFRALPLANGTHEVEMRFRPDCAGVGLIGSALFLAGAAVYAFLRRAT